MRDIVCYPVRAMTRVSNGKHTSPRPPGEVGDTRIARVLEDAIYNLTCDSKQLFHGRFCGKVATKVQMIAHKYRVTPTRRLRRDTLECSIQNGLQWHRIILCRYALYVWQRPTPSRNPHLDYHYGTDSFNFIDRHVFHDLCQLGTVRVSKVRATPTVNGLTDLLRWLSLNRTYFLWETNIFCLLPFQKDGGGSALVLYDTKTRTND